MNINKVIAEYFERRIAEGNNTFCLRGGRRSGKTFFACQFLLGKVSQGDVVNVASMTNEQGRLGAYADCRTIIGVNYPNYFEIQKSPRQINAALKAKDGRAGTMFFNSYQNSETAKGVACDWLFVNEANNFSKQQYTDLCANVRKGVILDFNPNVKFWVDDFFDEDEICTTTWKDNECNLTDLQLDYFRKLKELGDRPDANPIDKRNYLVYYCGVFSEITGKIFHSGNVPRGKMPSDLKNVCLFCDPSALRGNDYFAMCLCGWSESLRKYCVIDCDSVNVGTKYEQAKKIREYFATWDGLVCYIETNGIIGIDFYEFCIASDLPVTPYNSKGNKFERIVAQFETITQNTIFADTERVTDYLQQVYNFDEKCEHDDNVDAIASCLTCVKLQC